MAKHDKRISETLESGGGLRPHEDALPVDEHPPEPLMGWAEFVASVDESQTLLAGYRQDCLGKHARMKQTKSAWMQGLHDFRWRVTPG